MAGKLNDIQANKLIIKHAEDGKTSIIQKKLPKNITDLAIKN